MTGAVSYSVITTNNGKIVRQDKVAKNSIFISGLNPGRKYTFDLYPIGESGKKGTTFSTLTESTSNKIFNELTKVSSWIFL